MSSPADDEPPPGAADRAWLDALVGSRPTDPASEPAREGRALRIALEQRRRQVDASEALGAVTSDEAMDAQLAQLLRRAGDEGLIGQPVLSAPQAESPPAPTAAVIVFPRWRNRRMWLALAASVLIGTVVITQWTGRADYPAPPTMSGVVVAQKFRSAEPRRTAERFADDLRRAGLRPGVFQSGRIYTVDITLLNSEVDSARPAFDALGATAPKGGLNRVEFGRP